MDSQIIKFLRNEAADFKGRFLIQVIMMTDEQLERSHDCIQWMFPSDIRSQHSSYAPVLTEKDIQVMKSDKVVQCAIKTCLDRMLRFFENNDFWLTQRNHNYKRLTRMLRCLWLADMKHDYVSLSKALDDVFIDNPDLVGEETYLYWKNANNDSFMKSPIIRASVFAEYSPAPKQLPEDHASIEMFRAQAEFSQLLPQSGRCHVSSEFNYEDFNYV